MSFGRYQDPYSENPYGSEQASYQPNLSTEKVFDDAPQDTQRALPGRSGLRKQTKSWAEVGPPPRSTGILRMWRKDERGQQWTRGGGFRSTLRMCCCCLTITLILVISVILAIILFVRPPRVSLNDVVLGSSPVSLTGSGLSVAFSLGISVSNPNWFSVDFSEISATVRYPGAVGSLGGGTLYNVNFAGHADSTFDFPVTFNYTSTADPNQVVLKDLAAKCGVGGGAVQDITVIYDLDLHLKILGVSIEPKLSNSASFPCPITASDIEGIIGSG